MPATTGADFSILNDVQPGTKLRLIFRPEGLADLGYLLAMIQGGYLSIDHGDASYLATVRESLEWGRDRQITVTTTEKFDRSFFEGRMRRTLEKLEIVTST